MCFTADEERGESQALAEEVLENTRKAFGIGDTSSIGNHYPSNIPMKQTKTEWDLTSNDLIRAINYMIAGQPWPKYNLGPVELVLSYYFKLIDPISKIELPNQQLDSHILIWLSRTNFVSPNLSFPFEEPNESFWNYININLL